MGQDSSRPMTIKEVAAETGRGRGAVQKWIHSGVWIEGRAVKLAARRIGGRYQVTREALEAFIAGCNPGSPSVLETTPAREQRLRAGKEAALRMCRGEIM